MKLATTERLSLLTDEEMSYVKQLGVNHIIVRYDRDYRRFGGLIALKKWVEDSGLELCGIVIHRLIDADPLDKVFLGLPGRDEQIEDFCKLLRNMGKVGIPLVHYSQWVINTGAWLGNWRTTARTVGRGGAKYVSFDYEVAKKVPVSDFGQITDEQVWDNLTYFLKAVIPVAEESGVKMVMHPADPQVHSIAGVARIIRSVEAYDRLFEIAPSDYNCMLFCLGCFSQMLDTKGVCDAIRHFGTMGKIGHVHFRNVRGSLEKFDEVYPDEGKLDMLKALKTLNEAGYKGTISPDHGPRGTFDTDGYIVEAFQIGYLKGLLQSASALD